MIYRTLLSTVCVLGAVVALSGCQTGPQDSAVVSYEQIGACNGYQPTSTTVVSAGPHQAFVVFRIRTINTKGSTIALNFDPGAAFANVTGQPHIDPGLSLSGLFGVTQQPPVTVPANTIQGTDGLAALTVPTADADGAKEANQTAYTLIYPKQAGQPVVLMSKINGSQTSWPYTPGCLQIQYPT